MDYRYTCLIDYNTVLNATARLIIGGHSYDHVSSAMSNQLHWLKIDERFQYKLCIQVYKIINKTAPPYLLDMCKPVGVIDGLRRLRSAADSCLCVVRTDTKFGDRAVNVAGPVAWNNLPSNFCASTSLASFKRQMKPCLFKISYGLSWLCQSLPCLWDCDYAFYGFIFFFSWHV